MMLCSMTNCSSDNPCLHYVHDEKSEPYQPCQQVEAGERLQNAITRLVFLRLLPALCPRVGIVFTYPATTPLQYALLARA